MAENSESSVPSLDDIPAELRGFLRLGNDPKFVPKFLSLGVPNLDLILGGGLTRGQYTLVKGNTKVGKTYLLIQAFKAAIAEGQDVYLIDLEKSFNPDWYEKQGVDTSKIVVGRPPNGERAADLVEALIRRNVGMVCVDSLAAVVPGAELEKSHAENTVGLAAKLINRLTRELVNEIQDTTDIMVNQYRMGIGVSYGDPRTLPGGMGQEYFAWTTIEVKRSGWITKGDERVGFNMEFYTAANRSAAPFQSAKVPFRFEGGLQITDALVEVALDFGVIEARPGGNYYMDGERIAVRGREALVAKLDDEPEFKQEVESRVRRGA